MSQELEAPPRGSSAGQVFLVTGAGSGIGRAIALAAAKAGAAVVVNDLGTSVDGRQEGAGAAEAAVAEIQALGGRAIANRDSVADPEGAARMVAAAVEGFGRLDVVVNNAGILRDSFFHKMTFEAFDAVVKVHLYGSFNVSQAAAPVFRAQGGGAYIHMTSTSGLIGNLGQANYAAAKLGLVGLSKAIALDMRRWGVRSNCIAPFAESRMVSAIRIDSPEQALRVARLQAMNPAQIAPLVLFLGSNAGRDVTGQVFAVRGNEIVLMGQSRPLRTIHRDGGWTAETLAGHAMPALRPSFYDLAVSADVFPWDPV